jgi:hypothetical protein
MPKFVKELEDAAYKGFERYRDPTLNEQVKSHIYDIASKALTAVENTKGLDSNQISENWIDENTQKFVINFLEQCKDEKDCRDCQECLKVFDKVNNELKKKQRELMEKNLRADNSDQEQDDDFVIELEELIELFSSKINNNNKYISKSTRQKTLKALKMLKELLEEK